MFKGAEIYIYLFLITKFVSEQMVLKKISVLNHLHKVSQLLNKKLPIKHSEEYCTSSSAFISNIVKKNWNPETSDCMGQYFFKKGMRETSYFSYYMKLFDEPEAIADLQQDKQKPAIFFTHLLCLL